MFLIKLLEYYLNLKDFMVKAWLRFLTLSAPYTPIGERFYGKPAAWRECACYQRLNLPPPPSTRGCDVVNLHPSFFSIQVQVITRGFVFMRERLSCKPSSDVTSAITVYISASHTEAGASPISSHICHRCRLQEMVARV